MSKESHFLTTTGDHKGYANKAPTVFFVFVFGSSGN